MNKNSLQFIYDYNEATVHLRYTEDNNRHKSLYLLNTSRLQVIILFEHDLRQSIS